MALEEYLYPDSNVLINKLNITDEKELYNVERLLTQRRNFQLLEMPLEGEYDFQRLKEIHYYLFQDIYDWAGKVRTVNIAKKHLFCNVQYIEIQACRIFLELKNENYLKNLSRDKFCKRIVYYYAEINALHPFREGNGRALREFVRELSLEAGFVMDYSKISNKQMHEATLKSFHLDYNDLLFVFEKIILI